MALCGSEPRGLGETFRMAYAGDSITAMLAGKMARMAASSLGPTGPRIHRPGRAVGIAPMEGERRRWHGRRGR